jgi:hypothetical protein
VLGGAGGHSAVKRASTLSCCTVWLCAATTGRLAHQMIRHPDAGNNNNDKSKAMGNDSASNFASHVLLPNCHGSISNVVTIKRRLEPHERSLLHPTSPHFMLLQHRTAQHGTVRRPLPRFACAIVPCAFSIGDPAPSLCPMIVPHASDSPVRFLEKGIAVRARFASVQ